MSSRLIRHCSLSRIAELFKVLSSISGGWCGGTISLMVVIIILAVCWMAYQMWWHWLSTSFGITYLCIKKTCMEYRPTIMLILIPCICL